VLSQPYSDNAAATSSDLSEATAGVSP